MLSGVWVGTQDLRGRVLIIGLCIRERFDDEGNSCRWWCRYDWSGGALVSVYLIPVPLDHGNGCWGELAE